MQVPKTSKKQSFQDQQQNPTTETPIIAKTTADLPAGTDNSTIGTPVAHADHLTLQEGTKEAPQLGLIRSVTILSTVNSRPEDKLATNVASDGQAHSKTTLQMITKQGSKSIPVKVIPGMGCKYHTIKQI